jgi:hypothetical protein
VESVPVLKVLLIPEQAQDYNQELRVEFDDGSMTGLRIRNQVAVLTDGNGGARQGSGTSFFQLLRFEQLEIFVKNGVCQPHPSAVSWKRSLAPASITDRARQVGSTALVQRVREVFL